MNQAGCACAYVYDCCKLFWVFSAPVYPDRFSTLSSSSSSSRSHRHPSSLCVFFHSTFPSLDHSSFCRPAAPASSSVSKDARHRRVHRTSCSSCLLNRLDARLNYTRHHRLWRARFFSYIFFKEVRDVKSSASCTKLKVEIIRHYHVLRMSKYDKIFSSRMFSMLNNTTEGKKKRDRDFSY